MYEAYKLMNLTFRATFLPGLFLITWLTGLISIATVQLCMLTFCIIFVIIPLIFRYSVTLQRGILFLTFITYPRDLDLSNPNSVGLYGTRSFFLYVSDTEVEENSASTAPTVAATNTVNDDKNNSDNDNEHRNNDANTSNNNKNSSNKWQQSFNGVKIGVWHVLPKSIVRRFAVQLRITQNTRDDLQNIAVETKNDNLTELDAIFPVITPDNQQQFYERLLNLPGNTIILYLHGNTASRGSGHRLDVYKLLRTLGYHVITFDYRGYGDSDRVPPTEEGIVRDAMTVYKYIKSVTANPVIIWGHSLGTGVATNMLSQLNDANDMGPRGVILEAPFTNIRDEIRQHPFARPFKHLPWFDMTIARPMYTNSLRFESDQHISKFRQPVLILHAEDDYVVPFQLGYKLYRIALDTRNESWGPVEFHRFSAIHNYGHKHICYAPELPELIRLFVNRYRNEYF